MKAIASALIHVLLELLIAFIINYLAAFVIVWVLQGLDAADFSGKEVYLAVGLMLGETLFESSK